MSWFDEFAASAYQQVIAGMSAVLGVAGGWVTVKVRKRFLNRTRIVRLVSEKDDCSELFLDALRSEKFQRSFGLSGRGLTPEDIFEFLQAPKVDGFRQAHTPVEDFNYISINDGKCTGILLGDWYPKRGKAWIGYLFVTGSTWIRENYAPKLIRQFGKELRKRGAKYLFFDLEASRAPGMLKLYSRYLSQADQVQMYVIDVPFTRPPECSDSPLGGDASLVVADLTGSLASRDTVSRAELEEWLDFVIFDAHGDAEAPYTEEWEAHQTTLKASYSELLSRVGTRQTIAIKSYLSDDSNTSRDRA